MLNLENNFTVQVRHLLNITEAGLRVDLIGSTTEFSKNQMSSLAYLVACQTGCLLLRSRIGYFWSKRNRRKNLLQYTNQKNKPNQLNATREQVAGKCRERHKRSGPSSYKRPQKYFGMIYYSQYWRKFPILSLSPKMT